MKINCFNVKFISIIAPKLYVRFSTCCKYVIFQLFKKMDIIITSLFYNDYEFNLLI